MKKHTILPLIFLFCIIGTICCSCGSKDDDSNESKNIEPKIIYEENGLSIYYKGYTKKDNGVGLDLLIENNSDKTYNIQTDNFYINGYSVQDAFSAHIKAGKKANEDIRILKSELEKNDLSYGKVEDIEFNFHVFNSDDWSDSFDSPTISLKNHDSNSNNNEISKENTSQTERIETVAEPVTDSPTEHHYNNKIEEEKEMYKNDFFKLMQSYNSVSENDFDLSTIQPGNIRTKFHISNDDIYIEFIEIDNKDISLSIHGSDEVLKECIGDLIPSLKNEITKNDVFQAWNDIINNNYEINGIQISYYSWYGSTRIEMEFDKELIK